MEVLSELAILFILLAAITGIVCWRLLPPAGRLVAAQAILAFVTETAGEYLNSRGHKSNLWLYDFYMFFEFGLLLLAGYLLGPGTLTRRLMVVAAILFTIAWGYSAFTLEFTKLFTLAYIVACLLLVSMYLLQLMQMLKNGTPDRFTLLICYSTLFYFACVIPLFSFRHYLDNVSLELSRSLNIINSTMNLIRYNLMIAAFIICYRKQKLAGR